MSAVPKNSSERICRCKKRGDHIIDYPALCKEIEKTDAVGRRAALRRATDRVFGALEAQGSVPAATDALAALIVGCACEGGRISEREYLYMYPALASVFGSGYDFSPVKASFHGLVSSQKFMRKEAAVVAKAAGRIPSVKRRRRRPHDT